MKLKWFATTMSVLLYGWTGAPAFAVQEVPIYSFREFPPAFGAALLVMPNGTSFGVQSEGGRYGEGEVFKLSQSSSGTWTNASIYSFIGPQDGDGPRGKLVAGPNGSLYGATQLGGDGAGCSSQYIGCGTVFQLIPPVQQGAPWTKSILHSFSYSEGQEPLGLVIDSAGNLYGTTDYTVFELSPPVDGGGGWTLKILLSFIGANFGPAEDLLLDSKGNLFGSAGGGQYGYGYVFELTPNATGWSYRVVYEFQGPPNDGAYSNGGLRGGAGDIWGTTQAGGTDNAGTIFELRQELEGSALYTPIIHHNFTGGADGGMPLAGLFEADDGSYWGTTAQGGAYSDPNYCPSGCGVVFEIARKIVRAQVEYIYSVASEFQGPDHMDGAYPGTSLGADQNGSLYGVTLLGAEPYYSGTIFQLANAVSVLPTATPTFTPAAGTYTEAQSVAIADATPGAIIYYTTDSTNPTQNSTIYSSPITVSSSKQIKAIAYAPGYTKSTIAAANYTIELPAAAPTLSPQGGTYKGAVRVSMSDTTPGAKIYYTTDGTTPTTSSSVYGGSTISVTKTEQIKAIAVATGFTKSPVATVKYTITSS